MSRFGGQWNEGKSRAMFFPFPISHMTIYFYHMSVNLAQEWGFIVVWQQLQADVQLSEIVSVWQKIKSPLVEFPCHFKFTQMWLDCFNMYSKPVWQILADMMKILFDFRLLLNFVQSDEWLIWGLYLRLSFTTKISRTTFKRSVHFKSSIQ